ncbi:hypothetical protein [Sphingobium sp. AP50]|uniref:hypothetical protein n=1 Tax=Sphingobium sp. AP50 TaxID=1884369 RepID=UPI0015A6634D|nr:hypothetical protein [Sphingobium sp. AP50]
MSAIIALPGCTESSKRESEELMAKIETKIAMPQRAWPLKDYSRYYYWASDTDHRKVYGVLSMDRKPGRWWVEVDEAPQIMDGGCSVISLTYDVLSDRVVSIFCNGEA